MVMVSLADPPKRKEEEQGRKQRRKYKLNDKLLIILSSPLYNCLMLPVAITTELISTF